MQLTKNFKLEEFLVNSYGIKMKPTPKIIDNIKALAENCLQPIRDQFGSINITSGYRDNILNTKVGGSTTSQHCYGEAADFITTKAKLEDVIKWIVDNISFDQVILEESKGKKWIHISYKKSNIRKEALVANLDVATNKMKYNKYGVK